MCPVFEMGSNDLTSTSVTPKEIAISEVSTRKVSQITEELCGV